MGEYKVNTDQMHFNWLKHIQFDIQKLGNLFQNEGVTTTDKEIEDFKSRYLETKCQLEVWYNESLKRMKEEV
ncbi:hypothetical protein J32TS6_05240 [Virgibacillus pantothenticus]|uniref:hypothetical protein n=1 Tax=Virgibacillus pantothenticus TaxID=1473 RepID=UPI001B07816A|nr:hypothetical protein [Virgibacillus pantothenticus]GIP61969.1 hypothetical protein J32TS6_05240 [Virgibacillus pantothenticus]